MRTDFVILRVGVMSSGLMFAGSSTAQDITRPAPTTLDTPIRAVNQLGEDLQEALLSSHIQLAILGGVKGADALRIAVSCYGTSATLSGVIQDRRSEKAAMNAALTVPGVSAVHSVLTVNARTHLQDNLESHLRSAMVVANVRLLLLREMGATVVNVQVTGADGVVVLAGDVATVELKEVALRKTAQIPGVQRVDDQLAVVP